MIDHAAQSVKRKTKKQRVLEALSDGRVHSMQELNRITFRYGARILELRREGHAIESIQRGVDEWEYRLIVEGQKEMAL